MEQAQSALGLAVFLFAAWALGEDRRARLWRIALVGAAFQLVLGALLLRVPFVEGMFSAVNGLVAALQHATESGTSFAFGYLGGGPLPFEERQPGASFILAFRALPLILVVSALSSLLTYWRVLPWVVGLFAAALRRSFGLGGALGFGVAANVFVGMVEAPLFVRPYLARMSRSELFVLMTAGMATIAGTVLVLYATILAPVLPNAAGHLLVASLVSAPAAITIALLMVPGEPGDRGVDAAFVPERGATGAMDAVTRGTTAGLGLLLNVTAMLVVLVALVHLVDAGLGLLPAVAGTPLTLARMLGWVMAPVVWLMGVPWSEAVTAGALMGTKTVLNELLAYLQMAGLPPDALAPRSRLIMSYALCGFANFGSLGILIGGLATMVPERRDEVVALGMRSLVAGTLATASTGCVVGILTS